MNKFTIGSQWKTRGGWRAVVVDNDGLFIAVWHKTERESYLHYKDGMLQSNCPGDLDLIEPWVEHKEHDMTTPIRYVERKYEYSEPDWQPGFYETRTKLVLQYQTPSGEWVDVPVVRGE